MILLCWDNIVYAKISFFISKLPHKVPTPCEQKSKDNCESKVVLPLPVPPDKIVNSPGRNPLTLLLKNGNKVLGIPCNFYALKMLFLNLFLKSSNLKIFLPGRVMAFESNSIMSYGFFLNTSLASFNLRSSF